MNCARAHAYGALVQRTRWSFSATLTREFMGVRALNGTQAPQGYPAMLSETAMRNRILGYAALLPLATLLQAGAIAQQAPQSPQSSAAAAKAAKHGTKHEQPAVAPFQPGLEPRAIEILKAASARLAAAKSMAFTAVV